MRTRSSILKYQDANSAEIFQASVPDNGIIQAARNLPAEGQGYHGPAIDNTAVYTKVWSAS